MIDFDGRDGRVPVATDRAIIVADEIAVLRLRNERQNLLRNGAKEARGNYVARERGRGARGGLDAGSRDAAGTGTVRSRLALVAGRELFAGPLTALTTCRS